MSLIHWWTMNNTGNDAINDESLGISPINLSLSSFSTGGGESNEYYYSGTNFYINFSGICKNMTISYDIYRHDRVADWCTDMNFGGNAGTKPGNPVIGYCWQFSSNWIVRYPEKDNIIFSNGEELNKWNHIEMHFLNDTGVVVFFNYKKIIEDEMTSNVSFSRLLFLGAGSHNSGGGAYLKNIKIYDDYKNESFSRYFLYQDKYQNTYGI